ncbi:LolA family protein [Spirosoma koreense]
MKKQLITLVALAAIPALSFAQTADEIIDKNITALGGADKIAAVKTLEYEQTMSIQGMDLTSKSTFVVGKSMRSDISVMGQQITNVIDNDKGWMINPMMGGNTPQDMPAEALKSIKSATEPPMLQLAYAKSDKIPYELVGKEKFDGKDVFTIKTTRPEGAFNYYVDATNFQLLGFKGTVSMGGQQGETTAKFSDYKTVDGLSVPYSSEITAPGAPGAITAKITKFTVNGNVDPAIFAKPK